MRPVVPRELGEFATLLFEWPIRRSPRLALPLFILLAAFLQAGIIVAFSIRYRAPEPMLPAEPHIYLLPTDSVAARRLAPWLEANDPAVFSPLQAARDALPPPPPLSYRPSYEEPPPPLRPLPPEPTVPVETPPMPLLSLVTGVTVAAIPTGNARGMEAGMTAASEAPPGTVVRWQDGLAERALPAAIDAPATPSPAGKSAGQPSLYEVSVNAAGMMIHAVLLESSGDPESDEAGLVWIHAQHFQPSSATTWGHVQILWGAPAKIAGS